MSFQVRDNRGGNWWWAHNAIFDVYGKDLGPYGIAVYCCLCRHVGQDQHTWIAQRNLAEEIGASRTQVNRTVSKLRDMGLIAVDERQDEHGRATSIYTLAALPCTPTVQGSADVNRAGVPDGQGVSLQSTAMMNKTHGTRPMEQDVVTDLKKLWQTTLTDLQEQMVPTNFTRWVARTSLLSHEAGTAVVGVPDQISAEQLAKRFDPLVRRALADACGESVTVQYQVVEG